MAARIGFDTFSDLNQVTRKLGRAHSTLSFVGRRRSGGESTHLRLRGRGPTFGLAQHGRLDQIKWLETLASQAVAYRKEYTAETSAVALLVDASVAQPSASRDRLCSTAIALGTYLLSQPNTAVELNAVLSGRFPRPMQFLGSADARNLAGAVRALLKTPGSKLRSARLFAYEANRSRHCEAAVVVTHFMDSKCLETLRFLSGQAVFFVEPRVELWRSLLAGASLGWRGVGNGWSIVAAARQAYREVQEDLRHTRRGTDVRVVQSTCDILTAVEGGLEQ